MVIGRGEGEDPTHALLRDAAAYGPAALRHEVAMVLAHQGPTLAWDRFLGPVTARLDELRFDGLIGDDSWWRLVDEITLELRGWTRRRAEVTNEAAAVAVMGVDVDQHSLPLVATEAVLEEHGHHAWVVGARVTDSVIRHTTQRRAPSSVVLWAEHRVADLDHREALSDLVARTATLLAGPGWTSGDPVASIDPGRVVPTMGDLVAWLDAR